MRPRSPKPAYPIPLRGPVPVDARRPGGKRGGLRELSYTKPGRVHVDPKESALAWRAQQRAAAKAAT